MMRGQFSFCQGKRVMLVLVVLTLNALCVMQSNAQTTGRIYGQVTDSTGAAVTGATVTAANVGTDMKRSVTTNAEGVFNFTLLPVGKYQIFVEATGFKNHQREVELQVEAHLRMDFQMEVGQLTEQVIISTEAPQVDTASSTLGKVVEEKRIVDLPLNGRNFLQLGVLQAGVTPPLAGIDVVGSATNSAPGGAAVNFSVNGMRVSSNNHLLDGVNNVEPMSGAAMIVPSPDALKEFRILTNAYSAEFGRSGGSVVTVITRSGTNEYHGSLFEFLRNDVFDARNFFAPEVPTLKQNQFGGTLGGPIIKNRTFFFGSYEGFRQRKGLATSTTVPSLRVRQGDFSEEVRKPNDPLTGQPFPGGIIPDNRIDPVARNVLDLWPEPNLGSNTWTGAPAAANDRDQYLVRLDHTFLAGRNTVTGRYLLDEGSLTSPLGQQAGGGIGTFVRVPGFASTQKNRFQNLMIADTHVFSPRVINEFRFSYQRANVVDGDPVNQRDLGRLGFTYPITATPIHDPSIIVSGVSALGFPLLIRRVTNLFEFGDNVAINTGSHSIKLGVNVRNTKVFSLFPSRVFGSFTFAGAVTGHPLGDLLLGRTTAFVQAGGKEDKTLKQTAYYFYIQDDFRVSRNLTLNLGLRYELVPGFTERDNAQVTFRPGAQSVIGPTLPRGVLRSGDPGIPRTIFPTDKNNFAPRVGLAWDPFGDGKTSIRTGYGIFYDESALVQTFTLQQPPDLQPLVVRILPPSFTDPFNGNSPFNPPVQLPVVVPPGVTLTYIPPDLRLGYVQHWNLTAQRQLTPSMALEVAYVGNKGTKLQGSVNVNQAVWQPGATTGNANARRPFPGIAATFQSSSIFNSNYHGMQTTLTRRLTRGLSFQTSYTWSKAIDDTTLPTSFWLVPGQVNRPQNSRDLGAERGLSAFDVRHRFVASYIYELPFFRESRGAISYLLGGWKWSGITSLQSGHPFTVIDSSNPSQESITRVGDRTDVIRNPNLPSNQRTPEQWFDTSAFRRFVMPNYGNAGRNIVFRDGIANFDMGLAKDFSLGERRRLEFRWEIFNVFNHANFDVPDSDINSPSFGRVFGTSTPERIMQFALKFLF